MNSLDVLGPCFVCGTDAEAIYVTRLLLRLFFFGYAGSLLPHSSFL